MKYIILIVLSFLSMSNANAEIIVSYMHNSIRCNTCLKMEKWTKEAVSDLDVKFKSINTDEEDNKHFIKDYELYSKMVLLKDTKSGNWQKLDKLWDYVMSEDNFKTYIRDSTNEFLEKSK